MVGVSKQNGETVREKVTFTSQKEETPWRPTTHPSDQRPRCDVATSR